MNIQFILKRCGYAQGHSLPQIKAIHANWDKNPKKRAAKKRSQDRKRAKGEI